MRLTLRIDDELLDRARAHGTKTGRTLDELVDEGLRLSLPENPETATPLIPLPTFGGTGVLAGVTLGHGSDLRDSMENGSAVDSLR